MEKQEGKAKGKGEQENTKTSQTSSPPPELVQFLHMVASSELRIPSDVDPSHPLDPSVYAVGGGPRAASFKPEDPDPPVIVFSKTYCQFSTKAKKLLKSYDLSPPPKIIEVDLRDDSEHIKTLLTRLSHHSTFPNIFVQGVSLGGSDDLQRLHLSGELMTVLTNAGVDVQSEIADGLGPA
ncbi:thioredoxin-like protein [Rickenella mellea]|uniref:Thioredoxin-like protein n=1 Tax=Rickenella mellea TaxID=50990 RepID=A0A4Y7QEX1_9AGAM|nr:thioredoxin-like protein [Rickenella mellea]